MRISSLPPAVRANGKVAKGGPGADLINEAWDRFVTNSTLEALVIGQMLREQRDVICDVAHNQHTKEGDVFGKWLLDNCPKIPRTTAYRWMDLAERVIQSALGGHVAAAEIEAGAIEVDSVVIPLSKALTAPEEELPREAREARQLLFDFVGDKTMKECLAGVLVEGNEPHAITRAHNGRTQGGTKGEDRKAYAKFTGVKLKHITTFVNSNMSQVEQGKIIGEVSKAIKKWPKWVIKAFVEEGKTELKLSDEERAAREVQS